MTRLLVSVRDATEARTALEVGVDLLDLKEPGRGALGAVDTETVRQVIDLVAGRVPVSMALGELVDYFPEDESLYPQAALPIIPRGISLVKVGLRHCTNRKHWASHWRTMARSLPPEVSIVVVAYVDAFAANAPNIPNVVELAADDRCGAVLLDTAIKDGRSLVDHLSLDSVKRIVAQVQRRGVPAVVGGGLTLDTIPAVAACSPDFVAVRGAACSGPRTGILSSQRLRAVQDCLASVPASR